MARGILLVLLATPVCAAVLTMLLVVSGHVLASGEPFTGGEAGSALIFILGCAAEVALAVVMTARSRDTSLGVKALAATLVVGASVGAVGGIVFGLKIVGEKEESLTARIGEACARASHDRAIPGCEERARACLFEARANPPEVARGFDRAALREDDPHAPNEPTDRAVYDCLRASPPGG